MSGAGKSHDRITTSIMINLRSQLAGKSYELFSGDMKVQVSSIRYTYPNLSMACDPIFTDDNPASLINPILIVEILSPSTEKYDRGEKFFAIKLSHICKLICLFPKTKRGLSNMFYKMMAVGASLTHKA